MPLFTLLLTGCLCADGWCSWAVCAAAAAISFDAARIVTAATRGENPVRLNVGVGMERWFSSEWWEQQNWKGESTKITKRDYTTSRQCTVKQHQWYRSLLRALKTGTNFRRSSVTLPGSLYCSNSATSVTIVLYDNL